MKNLTNEIMIWKLFIKALLIGTLFSACQNQSRVESKETATNDKIQTVEVVKPAPNKFAAEILITGTALPNQKVILFAMESGFVKDIRKDIGDRVKKGEVIAILDNPELYRQKQKLKAQLQAKQSAYERLRDIHKKTPALTPIQQVEDAEAEYLTAKAELDAMNDRIGFLHVKAPFSGTITKRLIDPGALVQSGLTETTPQGIVELQETNPIRLMVPLPASDAATVNEDMEVTITFPELAGESFTAKVSRTAKSLDPSSKTMRVEIDIDNPKSTIITGMYAKVLMQIESRENVLSLPLTSQIMYQDEPFILIVKNSKVERIPLRKGLSGKEYFEVLNTNITAKSLVIVQGKGLVKPGQIVEPILKVE
ncbi:MAG: efflux RND transporter periplasmic adaptor subunit [Cyclobacteriaceae bacterium]|nr:efflux RND transporter periplasmic adaptor subunit [Cyclobacteriaceae bacterium]